MKEQFKVNALDALSNDEHDKERFDAATAMGGILSQITALSDSVQAFKANYPAYYHSQASFKIRAMVASIKNLGVTARQILAQRATPEELAIADEARKDTAVAVQIACEVIQYLGTEDARNDAILQMHALGKKLLRKEEKRLQAVIAKMEREKAKAEAKAAREAAKKGGGNG